jgi:hypothetical protein
VTASGQIRGLVEKILAEFPVLASKVEREDDVTRHLLNRLLVATDYASGCAALAENNLGPPLVPISRAMFESFVSTYWASQSEANGRVIVEAARREITRIIKLNLVNGRAKILHKETGEDKTKLLLRDPKMKDAQRLPQYAHMADGAGIRKIYDQLYGMLSLLSHASGADLLANRDHGEMINSTLHAVSADLRCIHLIISARINEKRVVRLAEVEAIMNVALA